MSLPRETLLYILNYFVYYFDEKKKEGAILRMSAKQGMKATREQVVVSVKSVITFSLTNKAIYELINHIRMNRMWKSCYFMLNKTYSDSLNISLAETNNKTATEVAKEKVLQLYWVNKHIDLQNMYKDALLAKDEEECMRLIRLEKLTNWISQSRFENEFIRLFFPDRLHLLWKVWPLISDIVPLEEWNLGRLIFLILDQKLPLDDISSWIKLMNHRTDRDIESVFTTCVEKYWVVTKGIMWQTIFDVSDKEFDVLSTFLLQLSIEYNRSITRHEAGSLYSQILCVAVGFGTAYAIQRIKFLYKMFGDDLWYHDILYLTLRTDVSYPYGKCNFLQVFDFWITEAKWNPSEQIEGTTLLHKFIGINFSSYSLLLTLFKKYGRLLSHSLIIKDTNNLLPIQLFTHIYTARRASSWIGGRFEEVQRVKIIELFVNGCPDLSVYRKQKVFDEIEKMIQVTGDAKAKYAPFLNKLK